jgi:N-acyl-D-aspartate/D-glutamate deacylase
LKTFLRRTLQEVGMTHQLVIRGGAVVDGTGAPAREADIAVDGGHIVAVGAVADGGEVEIDAAGRLVTPGWVDIHTHYDGQATWDPMLSPSCWHGVTTVVMGNCGVGFAPVAPDKREWLVALMEGVEDIPGTALHEGIRWAWESMPEYLDALESMPRALDVGAQVPHGALRGYVMGDRGADHDEIPTADEIAQMGRLARDGIAAGALGFTTSRTVNHKSSDGRHTPSLTATRDELVGIAREIGAGGRGVIEAVADFVDLEEEFGLLLAMVEASGRPLSISTMQSDARPDGWRQLLGLISAAAERGLPVRGQVASRAVGVLMGLQSTTNPFIRTQAYQEILALPLAEKVARWKSPDYRDAMLAEMAAPDAFPMGWGKLYQLGDPPNYEPSPEQSIAAHAQREGRSPAALAYELMLERDGRELLYVPFNNYTSGNLDVVREMITHPYTVPGLGDAGAHCGLLCDGSFPTFLLAHWGKDRPQGRLPVEWLVKRQTKDTADLVGLNDRGVLVAGRKADLNVIDFDALALTPPEIVYDLPAGGRRLVQRADGYAATVVSGTIVMRDGEPTGALPGRLVRGAQGA